MPGKAKYCEHCKGYGGLFVQVIKRFGDDRIKERCPEKPTKENCEPCKGTGMISIETDKVPVFDVDEQSSAKMITKNLENLTILEEEEDDEPDKVLVSGVEYDEYKVQQEEEFVVEAEEEEQAIDEEPVDADDPVVFEEFPVDGDEMAL